MKRLIFPIINGVVFALLFAVVGYYVFELALWTAIGFAAGLGVGLLVEFGLGKIGGWVYRRRVTLTVLIEVVLIFTIIGPFIYFYLPTTPLHYPVCCIADSGLGDQAEEVRIPVADGETLAGWYAPPAEDDGAVVMVLHGSRSDRTNSLSHAQLLHRAGYGVLVYDQRASGESTGTRQSYGLYDQRDITPIIDWLAARPEVDMTRGVGGVGLSLGAHILVMAAPNEPRLNAIWSDGLGINTLADLPPMEGVGNQLITFINGQALWLGERYLGVEFVSNKVLIPQITPRSLMLVAAGADPYEADFNRGYEPFLGENAELWVIESAGHVGGLWTIPDVYTTRMLDFFDEALRA